MPAHGRWLELVAWGPHGVSDGPSPVAYDGPVPFLTAGDAAPIEYATDADRPFTGADLVVETSTGSAGWASRTPACGSTPTSGSWPSSSPTR